MKQSLSESPSFFPTNLCFCSLSCTQVYISCILLPSANPVCFTFLCALCACWLKWVIVQAARGIKNSSMLFLLAFIFFSLLSRRGLITFVDLRSLLHISSKKEINKEANKKRREQRIANQTLSALLEGCIFISLSRGCTVQDFVHCLPNQQQSLNYVITMWINVKEAHHTEYQSYCREGERNEPSHFGSLSVRPGCLHTKFKNSPLIFLM